MELVICVLTILTSIQYVYGYGASCPIGLSGKCVPLNDCDELKTLIKGTAQERESLKQWHCGFDKDVPDVCCPSKLITTIPIVNIPKIPISTTTIASTTKTPRPKPFTPKAATTKATTTKAPNTTTKPTTIKAPLMKASITYAPLTPTSTTGTSTTTVSPPDNICYTLEATQGTCVALTECPTLVEMLRSLKKTSLEYVQRSRCIGPVHYSVCCDKPLSKNLINNGPTEQFSQIERIKRKPKVCDSSSNLPNPISDCCGIEKTNRPLSIRKHPWLVIIEYNEGKNYKCGGSLINSLFIITAAHCIFSVKENADKGAKSVRLGEYNITNEGKDCILDGDKSDCTDGAISIEIASIHVHPKYNKDDVPYANDIALIKLKKMAPYNDFIRPICLPATDITLSPQNQRFQTAGWGTIDKALLRTSDIKLETNVPFVNYTNCRDILNFKDKKIVWEKQVCAGGEPNKNSCKGDPGGPLVNKVNKNKEIIGIFSYGLFVCGLQEKPSVYTKVYDYLPWIMSIIEA